MKQDKFSKAYKHGEDTRSIASIVFDKGLLEQAQALELSTCNYEIYTEEELEEKYKKKDGISNEEEQQAHHSRKG